MTAAISYIFNGSDLSGEASINHLFLNIPAYDADTLYAECRRLKLETDWWYSKANRVTLRAGTETSEAYLLLRRGDFPNSPTVADYKGTSVNQDWRNAKVGIIRLYQGKSDLAASEIQSGSPGQWDIKGWMFHSAMAVNAAEKLADDEIIYLVKFVDTRFHWARSVNTTIASQPDSYNVIDRNSGITPGDYTDTTAFPYVSSTVTGPHPYTFSQVLDNYWSLFAGGSLPSGGSYPTQYPLDIRPEDRTHYATFMELLHSTANELYPTLDGNFTISPIDANFSVTFNDPLKNYSQWLIDEGHPQPDLVRIPNGAGLRFRKVYLDSTKRISNFYLSGTFDTTLIAWGGKPIFIDEEFSQEVFTSFAMVYAPGVGSDIDGFTEAVLTRYYKSRNTYQYNRVYSRFIPLPPSAYFEEVEFACVGNIITTAFRSIEASVGASFLPENFDDAGGTSDHLVIADSADEVPESFYDTVVDHSTFDSGVHQVVYAQVIEASAGPPVNDRIKLFTATITGATGSTGLAGTPGDTVISGYCIVVAHAGTVAQPNLDLTLASAWSNTPFQFFAHLDGVAGVPADPKWITVSNYVGGDDQIIWHRSGSAFKAQTTTGYSTAAGATQFLLNSGGNWFWVGAWKVACTGVDLVASYLHDAWLDPGPTYEIDKDFLVKFITIGAAGTDQKERAFIRNADIFGWTTGKFQSLVKFPDDKVRWFSDYRLCYGIVTTDSPVGSGTVDLDNVTSLADGGSPVSSSTDVITADKWTGHIHGIAITTPEYLAGDKLLIISTLPNSDDWLVIPFGEGGADGASGTFVCELSGDIGPASPGVLVSGSASVSSISSGGSLTPVGTHVVFNPFTCKLPASGAQYTCAKTYAAVDPADDEFTITGPDIMAILFSLTGAGAATSLAIPESGSSAADIQWLGGECED